MYVALAHKVYHNFVSQLGQLVVSLFMNPFCQSIVITKPLSQEMLSNHSDMFDVDNRLRKILFFRSPEYLQSKTMIETESYDIFYLFANEHL